MKKIALTLCWIVITAAVWASQLPDQGRFRLRFSYTDEISKTPINGRIIVVFNSDVKKPIQTPTPLDQHPAFALDVRDWKPGASVVLDRTNALSWKGDLDSLDGWYGVQALLRIGKKTRSPESEGNAVTVKNVVYIERGKMARPLDLLFQLLIPKPRFRESEFLKEAKIPSPLMTQFFGEPEFLLAAVILPPSYFKEPGRQYPSVYVMGGYGSSHFDAISGNPQKRYGMAGFGGEKIFIFLNGESRTGYHVFCDSETNGPREQTFFREIIPFIEKEYRVNKNPETRFLMGQSTGAWSGLWLLINHPDAFGGAYVASPDPVDFTDFLGTNIYDKNANMFFNAAGDKKVLNPEAKRPGGWGSVSIEDFVWVDKIAGWGEQMYSFDATFSPKGGNGEPLHLFDWETGKVNPEVAASWERNDLSKLVSRLDGSKKQSLQGKIHLFVADDDDFGLNRPVRAFRENAGKTGLEAEIRFLTSGGHNIWTEELRKSMHEDMDRRTQSAAQQIKTEKRAA